MISFANHVSKMITKYLISFTLVTIVFGTPVEITFPRTVHSIAFPKLINKIKFKDDQGSCKSNQVCKSFKDCDSALKLWKEEHKLPETCHFQGKEQYVCCEKENHDLRGTIIRKSKYMNELNILVNPQYTLRM